MKLLKNMIKWAVMGFISASTGFSGFALNKGDVFPDLSQYNLEGSLPDLKGKVVLVDFFASWCVPCRSSFPAMQELQEKYRDKGLVIVAVNVDKKRSDMEAFLKKYPASFSIVRDASTKLVSEVKVPTMPTSFLVDRSGKIAAVHSGFHGDDSKRQYVAEIEALLK